MPVRKKKAVLVTLAVLVAVVLAGAALLVAIGEGLEDPGPGMSGWQCDPDSGDC
jgi:hypothetical protein